MQASAAASMQLENALRVEREQATVDRQNLLSQITNLVMNQGAA
jgi:kinesin family protein 11